MRQTNRALVYIELENNKDISIAFELYVLLLVTRVAPPLIRMWQNAGTKKRRSPQIDGWGKNIEIDTNLVFQAHEYKEPWKFETEVSLMWSGMYSGEFPNTQMQFWYLIVRPITNVHVIWEEICGYLFIANNLWMKAFLSIGSVNVGQFRWALKILSE